MYLKFIRHNQPYGTFCRGTLYSVHFQPNEKGGYNEHLTFISDAYEIPGNPKSHTTNYHTAQADRKKSSIGGAYPLLLIFKVGLRRANGHLRLTLGTSERQSMLHLIDCDARERFFSELLHALSNHEEVRIDLAEAN